MGSDGSDIQKKLSEKLYVRGKPGKSDRKL